MQHVTPLAEAPEIGEFVVRRIAVEVGSGEHDARLAKSDDFNQVRPSRNAAPLIAPRSDMFIEPATVGQTAQRREVGTSTSLASAAGASEADKQAEVTPVWGVESTQFRADRHW